MSLVPTDRKDIEVILESVTKSFPAIRNISIDDGFISLFLDKYKARKLDEIEAHLHSAIVNRTDSIRQVLLAATDILLFEDRVKAAKAEIWHHIRMLRFEEQDKILSLVEKKVTINILRQVLESHKLGNVKTQIEADLMRLERNAQELENEVKRQTSYGRIREVEEDDVANYY